MGGEEAGGNTGSEQNLLIATCLSEEGKLTFLSSHNREKKKKIVWTTFAYLLQTRALPSRELHGLVLLCPSSGCSAKDLTTSVCCNAPHRVVRKRGKWGYALFLPQDFCTLSLVKVLSCASVSLCTRWRSFTRLLRYS